MHALRLGRSRVPGPALLLLIALLLTGSLGLGEAGPAVEAELQALAAAKDAKERVALVRRLARIDGAQVVATLARLARSDPSTAVRLAAVAGVGTSLSPKAEALLLQVLLYGGPLPVRRATAEAVRTRTGAGAAALALLQRRGVTRLGQGLVVAALGFLRDPESLAVLTTYASDPAAPLRGEAIRALARRRDNQGARLLTFARLLRNGQDDEVLLSALDAAETLASPVLSPLARRLSISPTPTVRAAAKHLLWYIGEQRKASIAKTGGPAGASAKEEGDRYAKPKTVPEEKTPPPGPGPRARSDLVYLLDATGSAYGSLAKVRARILRQAARMTDAGGSVRIGIIAYRCKRSAQRSMEILPLTYELARLPAFLDGLRASGSDDRGAAIGTALHEALDRMDWRTNTHRHVELYADAGIANARRAKAIVDVHYRTDATRTGVAYFLRTRTKVPPELTALAKLGGTAGVETIR